MDVKVTVDGRQAIDALPAVDHAQPAWCIYRFPDHKFGDDVHAAINAWLDANGIPSRNTPREARFALFGDGVKWPAKVQIEQFDMDVTDGHSIRTVSLSGSGFVKTERIFDLKSPVAGFEPIDTGRI